MEERKERNLLENIIIITTIIIDPRYWLIILRSYRQLIKLILLKIGLIILGVIIGATIWALLKSFLLGTAITIAYAYVIERFVLKERGRSKV